MQLIKSVTALVYAILLALGITSVDPDGIVIDGVPEKSAGDLRIVSFNLRTADDIYGSVKNRSVFISKTIEAYHPDSFGVQECNSKWLRNLEEYLGSDYEHVGEPRDGSKNTEYSCVFFLKEKFELLDEGTIWLSETPEVFGSKSFSSSMPRICTWAVLRNKETGETYTHLNTHLDHLLEKARVGQAGVLLEKAAELSAENPVVITGDFNADEKSETYSMLTESFADSRKLAEESESGKTFHNYGLGDPFHSSAIDFVFVPKNVWVTRYKIIDNKVNKMYLSDHYGLCVDLRL